MRGTESRTSDLRGLAILRIRGTSKSLGTLLLCGGHSLGTTDAAINLATRAACRGLDAHAWNSVAGV
jgi:hypothetical protein